MNRTALLTLLCALLCGCTPDPDGRSTAAGATAGSRPLATTANSTEPAPPAEVEPSYEVSIASAAADRLHALEGCSSKAKVERATCTQAADAEYEQAKSAAESRRKGAR
jgi:hypothetical protein